MLCIGSTEPFTPETVELTFNLSLSYPFLKTLILPIVEIKGKNRRKTVYFQNFYPESF